MARYGYARVSTGDQHPEVQEGRLIAAGCAEPVFTDTISGTKDSRPKWDMLLAQLAPGDELACIRLDRIGRSARHLHNLFEELKNRNVGLICLDQAIDTTRGKGWDDPMAQLLIGVLAILAEFERRLIIERTLDGQQSVRRAGNLRKSLGGRPVLGFADPGGGDDRDWVLDPVAAKWLADAAEMVLNGDEVEAVHGVLPEITDAAGRPVSAKMLRAALQRPASAGLITDNGGYLPAAIGGPLDETTWRRLQVLFGGRKLGRRVDAGRYWAGPVLRCGKCGNQLTGEVVNYRGDRRDYYRCGNPHKALGVTRPCRGCSVLAEDVHDLIGIFVEAWMATPEARLVAERAADTSQTAGRRAELADEIARLQEQVAGLEVKLLRRHITRDRYAELEAEATVMIDQAAAELAELDRIEAEPGLPELSGWFEWEELTAAEKLAWLREAAVTPIIVQPGNGGAAARSAADRVDLRPR